jgi:L-asparaginase II
MFVELVRGTTVESRHRVHAAVVDAHGRLIASTGDPSCTTFMRSVAKPFQAMPLVADGAADALGLTSEDLALACASHSSEPGQVERVRAFLARVGASETDLMCGAHTPLSDAVAREYAARGVTLGAVHSNCSGKHTGMLALARFHGWPLAAYVRPDHPVQRRCLAEVSRWTDVPEQQIGTAVDGCGVVCFAVPVAAMALGYARLAIAECGVRSVDWHDQRNTAGSSNPQSAIRIPQSMIAHPALIAGKARPCTELMLANPGKLIAKVGAEGVYAAALIDQQLGVALKIEDGHSVASALAMAAVLAELGLAVPAGFRRRAITNSRGESVGELRVNGGVTR